MSAFEEIQFENIMREFSKQTNELAKSANLSQKEIKKLNDNQAALTKRLEKLLNIKIDPRSLDEMGRKWDKSNEKAAKKLKQENSRNNRGGKLNYTQEDIKYGTAKRDNNGSMDRFYGGRNGRNSNMLTDLIGDAKRQLGGIATGFIASKLTVDYFKENAAAFRELRNSSEGTINSINDMRMAASDAYMRIDEFANVISKASTSTRILGATNFSKVYKSVLDVAKQSNYFGATSKEEFSDVLDSYIETVGRTGRLESLSQEDAKNATLQLVQTNSGLAKLMGLNREDLNKQLASANVDKDLSLLLSEMFKGNEARLQETNSVISLMPDNFGKMVKELLLTGGAGFVTPETGQFAAQNPALQQLAIQTARDLANTNIAVSDTMNKLGDRGKIAVSKDVGGLQGAQQRALMVTTGVAASAADDFEYFRKMATEDKVVKGLERDKKTNNDAFSGIAERGKFIEGEMVAAYDKLITNAVKPFGDAMSAVANSTTLSFTDLAKVANSLTSEFSYLGAGLVAGGLVLTTFIGGGLVKILAGSAGLIGTAVAGLLKATTSAVGGLAAGGAARAGAKVAAGGAARAGAKVAAGTAVGGVARAGAGMLVRGGGAVLAGLVGLASSPVLATLATIAAGAWAVSEIMDTTDKYEKLEKEKLKKTTTDFIPKGSTIDVSPPTSNDDNSGTLIEQQKITNNQLKRLNELMYQQNELQVNNMIKSNENLTNLLKSSKEQVQSLISVNGF